MSTTHEHQTGVQADKDIPILGEQPTAEEIEQVTWAEEAIRAAPGLLRDNLRQLITLDTALLAGSAAFLDKMPMLKELKVLGVALLLISLFSALWGSLPREAQVCPYAPDEIRRARATNLNARLWSLRAAGTFLFLALVVFTIGVLF